MHQTKTKPNLTQLKRRLRAAGITQEQVASLAAVTKPHVCSVLAGRYKSRRVIEAARRLLKNHDAA